MLKKCICFIAEKYLRRQMKRNADGDKMNKKRRKNKHNAKTIDYGIVTMDVLSSDKKATKNIGSFKAFITAFCVTCCVGGALLGALIVDFNGRRMSLNDSSPIIAVTEQEDGSDIMSINAFGYKNSFEVTRLMEYWEKFKDFCCIP